MSGLLQPNAAFLADLQKTEWFQRLHLDRIDWQEHARDAAQGTGQAVFSMLTSTSRGTLQGLITAAVTFFTMFYFFLDGEKMVARLKYLSPLSARHENAIIQRFAKVARATVSGTVIIALIQGRWVRWCCGSAVSTRRCSGASSWCSSPSSP